MLQDDIPSQTEYNPNDESLLADETWRRRASDEQRTSRTGPHSQHPARARRVPLPPVLEARRRAQLAEAAQEAQTRRRLMTIPNAREAAAAKAASSATQLASSKHGVKQGTQLEDKLIDENIEALAIQTKSGRDRCICADGMTAHVHSPHDHSPHDHANGDSKQDALRRRASARGRADDALGVNQHGRRTSAQSVTKKPVRDARSNSALLP